MTKLIPSSVASLNGAILNWAVAQCLYTDGRKIYTDGTDVFVHMTATSGIRFKYQPSTNWAQGGPIIEREKIDVNFSTDDNSWIAGLEVFDEQCNQMYKGHTALIAAMRCYVASKLGDTVEIPEELL